MCTPCGPSTGGVDYYWRDYTGEIPCDAIEGGRGKCDGPVYIGIVYVHDFGVCPVTIHPGQTCVRPSVPECYKPWNFIKILCSPYPNKFKWIQTNGKNFHCTLFGKHVIPGGVEHGGKVTYIGRIKQDCQTIISKVCGFEPEPKLYFPKDCGEGSTLDYEVLIYA